MDGRLGENHRGRTFARPHTLIVAIVIQNDEGLNRRLRRAAKARRWRGERVGGEREICRERWRGERVGWGGVGKRNGVWGGRECGGERAHTR